MIGVFAEKGQHSAVREFFQLFKTPWEFFRAGMHFDALLCSRLPAPETTASLVVIYGTGDAAVTEVVSGGQTIVRIGRDLFAEVEDILTHGQPVANARVPTLDLEIAFLRDLLLRHSLPLLEIPPLPAGHDFIACLTHDVDHPRMRDHFGDHTMFGFLYRAFVGSLIDLSRGRKNLKQVAENYLAALSLPFVYLGIAPDFWNRLNRYREMEGDARSTFFVIPTKGDAGENAPRKRAASYSLTSLSKVLRGLISSGCEIGVHGIDAWRDADKGRAELEKIRTVTGEEEIGVRMHWLYFDEGSPARLEEAGYSYDSTIGYNDAVGYRAGTTQVFKPLKVERLLELPLHAMDTAMFYPDHMNLTPAAASKEMDALIENAVRLGGVLTINWHDRSIAPERLWNEPYLELVEKLRRRGAWMPTAGEAVSWFRARRSARIEVEEGVARVALAGDETLPGFRLRVHHPAPRHKAGSKEETFTDLNFMNSAQFQLEPAALKVNAA